MPPETCPQCGAIVPRKARACPECGSDESTGWSERAYSEHLGIPTDDFDYNRFVEDEFKGGRKPRRKLGWLWSLVALGLALWFLATWLRF